MCPDVGAGVGGHCRGTAVPADAQGSGQRWEWRGAGDTESQHPESLVKGVICMLATVTETGERREGREIGKWGETGRERERERGQEGRGRRKENEQES